MYMNGWRPACFNVKLDIWFFPFFHRQAKLRVRKHVMYYRVIFVCDASRDASKSALIKFCKEESQAERIIYNVTNLILLLAFAFRSVYMDCNCLQLLTTCLSLHHPSKSWMLVPIFFGQYSLIPNS